MDAVLLARIQFAISVGVHYVFPPMTIGLSWLIVGFMYRYWRTGQEVFGKLARFWIGVFALGFASGVATGIVMEFQFGTNWSEYSRFVGDIFGAPLAAEGLIAFFLESSFLGVLLFGWKRFKPGLHFFASLMVAVGSTMSAFWIIVANSWQQTPAGYHLVNGRAELTDFWAAVFNPSTVLRFNHVIVGALLVGSFFMMGISAWFVLRDKDREFARHSFKTALILAAIVALAQLGFGHAQAVRVWETQPEKLAAVEGHWETSKGAPILVFGIPDAEEERTKYAIGVPYLMSFLLTGDPKTEIKGLKEWPRDERPPLGWTFYPFHIMFLSGVYMILLTAFGIFLMIRKKLWETRWYIKLVLFTFPVVFLADHCGWIAAEVGRQPWIVYHLLKTVDAVSPLVTKTELIASLTMFSIIYALLIFVWLFLLIQKVKAADAAGISGATDKEVVA